MLRESIENQMRHLTIQIVTSQQSEPLESNPTNQMKSSILFPSESRTKHRSGFGVGIFASTILFAAHRGTAVAAPSKSEEAEAGEALEAGGDTGEEEPTGDETSQPTGTATGTGTGTAAKTKVSTKTMEEAQVDQALLTLIKSYDEVKEKATSYMCDMAEHIGKNNLGRPVVIKTLMEARGITIESASSTASRLITLAKDPEAIAGLRDGTLTIRETVYGKKKPAATAGATGEGGTGETSTAGNKKSDTEKKEDRYNRKLGEFVDVAKECGYTLDEIMTGVRASLKDKGVK